MPANSPGLNARNTNTVNQSVYLSEEGRTLRSALYYAGRGWAIVPLAGKLPAFDVVPHGVHSASRDPTVIRDWFTVERVLNIGIAAGASDMLIVDADAEGLAAWYALAVRFNFPDTWTVKSGGGGEHWYYRMPEGVRHGLGVGRLKEVHPKIHIRGHGGYIVAPPSIHPETGRRYELVDQRDPVELPSALLQILQPPTGAVYRRCSTANATGVFITTGAPIPEGNRNHQLFRVGCAARARGLHGPELEATLHEVNQNRCRPPLPDAEVTSIARSAARYAVAGDRHAANSVSL